MMRPNHNNKCWKCNVLLFWLGLGTKATWLGSGKDDVLAQNAFYGLHKHSCRCCKVSSKKNLVLVVTNVCMDESFLLESSVAWTVNNLTCHVRKFRR